MSSRTNTFTSVKIPRSITHYPDVPGGIIRWDLKLHPDGHHYLHAHYFGGTLAGKMKNEIFIGCTKDEAIAKADEYITDVVGL